MSSSSSSSSSFYLVAAVVGIVLSIAAYIAYQYRDHFELKCILSSVDGNRYCVRDTRRQQESADLLAQCTARMQKLVDHVAAAYPDNAAVKRLVNGFNAERITETLPNSEYVAYSENKSKMAFCLTEQKNGAHMIDLNTLMFVAIHELAHIASKSIGHKQEFWDNFKFLLVEAEQIGVYRPENYKEQPREFCGMKINDSPYFDM